MRKSILIILSILLFVGGIVLFLGYSFHLMEIEDHYGDLQKAYYNSKNGDLILNEKTKKVGMVKKDWKTIHVLEVNNKETDLYNWVYINGKEIEFKIYRTKNELDNKTELEYSNIIEKAKLGELELIETK